MIRTFFCQMTLLLLLHWSKRTCKSSALVLSAGHSRKRRAGLHRRCQSCPPLGWQLQMCQAKESTYSWDDDFKICPSVKKKWNGDEGKPRRTQWVQKHQPTNGVPILKQSVQREKIPTTSNSRERWAVNYTAANKATCVFYYKIELDDVLLWTNQCRCYLKLLAPSKHLRLLTIG